MLDRTLLDTREGFRKCVNPDFSLFFVVILYFFLAALSLHWCMRAFSSCSEWRLLSSCGTWTLGRVRRHQAPPSVGFSRQEYWSGLPFPPPGILPNPGIEPRSPTL